MRKRIALLAVLTVAMSLPALASAQSGGLRYSITVTKFENKAGWSGRWDIGDAWGTVLTDLLKASQLVRSGSSPSRAGPRRRARAA